jgi:hypothetical protein
MTGHPIEERMVTMRRFILLSISASLACMAAPALAERDPIIVAAEPETQSWLDEVSRTLNGRMESGTGIANAQRRDGVVQITFESGPDGRPIHAEYLSKSGNFQLDRSAWRAVAGLKNLRDLPPAYAGRTAFQANIIHASSERSYERQMEVLAGREDAQRLASSGRKTEVLAINAVVRPAG